MRLFWARGRSVALGCGVTLLIWSGAATAAESAPAPELAESVGRLAELGMRYRWEGNAAGLAAVEKKLADMKTDRPAALLALGRLLHAEEKDTESASVLEQALALKPEDFEVESELGPVYSELGQYEKAALIMENVLKHRPQKYGLTIVLAKCYARMGRVDQAKATFAQAKRLNSKEATAYIEQGYAYLNAGQDAQARREFESLIAVDTANPLGYHHMGSYLSRRHQYHEAEEYYRQAVQRLESSPLANRDDLDHALSNLALTLRAQGKLAEAETVYRKGLEQTRPGAHWRSEFLGALGMLAEAQGKPAEAERLCKQAMAACEPGLGCSHREWADAAIKLGALYAAQGRNPEADAMAERIGKLYDGRPIDEDSIEHFLHLAELYTGLGRSAKAEALWRRMLTAREAMPTHVSMGRAEAALAGLCARQGRWAEAEDLYLKATEVFKIQGYSTEAFQALDGLAAAYEKEGKGSEAAAARRQAQAFGVRGGKS